MSGALPDAASLSRAVYSGWACVHCGASLALRGGVPAGRAEGHSGAHDLSVEVYACPPTSGCGPSRRATPSATARAVVPHPQSRKANEMTAPLRFAWLEVTGRCNLECTHCYADSSPRGTHGTMTVSDWAGTITQLAAMGARDVQFIGGEPLLYPRIVHLIIHAREAGLTVEVFSNLTAVSETQWQVFKEYDVRLATSYYSDTAADHDAVTDRKGSHARTRANIMRAQELGLTLRGGVIQVRPQQRAVQAQQDLKELGLTVVGADRTRAFGRASRGATPTMADLCGHCADGKVAVGPDGDVWPCVLGRFISLGNVKATPLADIWAGPATRRARSEIEAAHGNMPAQSCTPPQFLPMCGPCSPCVPSVGHCDPRIADAPAATIGSPSGD